MIYIAPDMLSNSTLPPKFAAFIEKNRKIEYVLFILILASIAL